MYRRAALVLVVLAVAGCAGSRPGATLEGVWTGTVTEGDERYSLTMTLDRLVVGERAGTAAYSGAFTCTGTLTLDADTGGIWVFREAIDDTEQCADNGRIEVTPQDGRLAWNWYRSDAERAPDATAILERR